MIANYSVTVRAATRMAHRLVPCQTDAVPTALLISSDYVIAASKKILTDRDAESPAMANRYFPHNSLPKLAQYLRPDREILQHGVGVHAE